MAVPSTTNTSRLSEWERFLVEEARRLAEGGVESASSRRLAREALRQMADLAEYLGETPCVHCRQGEDRQEQCSQCGMRTRNRPEYYRGELQFCSRNCARDYLADYALAGEVPEWVPVSPNTAIASASALRGAAEIHRRDGNEGQADGCEELARRLTRDLPKSRDH